MASRKGLFEKVARRPSHRPTKPRPAKSRLTTPKPADVGEAAGGISDAGGRGIGKAIAATLGTPNEVPGPSTNPATNLIIHDIAMRAGGRLMRHTLEKGLLRGRYSGSEAKAIVENRSLTQTLLSGLLARYATRSLPGAALIGGSLVVKTLLDRRKSKKSAKRAGDKTLSDMAKK